MASKLFLIDTSSLIYRAFYAIRGLSTAKGVPTNATYGFLTMLLGVLEKQKPDYIACLLDTPKPTFRKEMFADYKANRGAPPDDLLPQFDQIHRAIDAIGVRKLAAPGYEADDLIATFCDRFKDCDITIISGDKDLMQLVNGRVKILDTMKNVVYGPDEVKAKLGVDPAHVTDYLGLIGDTSDNIPGIPGVGPKTAIELLAEYGSLEAVLNAAPLMKPGRRRDLLIEHAESARLSQKLATVHPCVGGDCSNVTLEELRAPQSVDGGYGSAFADLLREFEFKTLAKKYSGGEAAAVAQPLAEISAEFPQVKAGLAPAKITLVSNPAQWEQCLKTLGQCPVISFDTETRGDRCRELELVGLSLSGDGKEAFYVPARHQGDGTADQVSPRQVVEDFLRLVDGKEIVAQNIKYDYKILLSEHVEPEWDFSSGRVFDTMLMDYLVDPEEKHGLDALAARYLDTAIGDFKETLGDRPDFSLVPLSSAAHYSGLDAWSTWNLHQPLKTILHEREMEKLLRDIEMPTAQVLAHMEWEGVAVDRKVLEELSNEFARELAEIEKQIFKEVGQPFNLNSPKQLSDILFTKLGLPVISKTKTGFSTDVTVLNKLAPMHPVPALILRNRELTKLKGTYVDVLPTLIENDGRVHAHFNQSITATGRLSSSDPNMQNIPIKTESGRKIRRAFVAGPGCKLVGADYSQIELRLVAHLSGDERLIAAFRAGEDIHRATAAEVFHVKPEEVTDRQRGAAKAINFGLIYGQSAFGLAQQLNISRTEAQSWIDAYFAKYKSVKAYMEKLMADAHRTKLARTMFGRERPLKDIDNRNVAVRNNAERMAMNMPLQGTAADIMKLAMVRAFKSARKTGSKVVLQVHDELVLDVPDSRLAEAKEMLRHDMEKVADLSVPLAVNLESGENWMEM